MDRRMGLGSRIWSPANTRMANNDWIQAPDMSAYPTVSVAQYMNQATRDIAVTKESGEVNKRRQANETTHHRNRPRPNQWSPSWTRTFSPIIIAGSPDLLPSDTDPPSLQNEQEEPDIDSDEDIELYYKAYNKYRPEMDESNAESRERSNLIYQEHQRLKKEKAKKVKESQKIGFHTPETQIRISNNGQELNLQTPHANAPEVIQVIMDTGAALSMFTGSVTSAWTNLRPCLYSISGCFSGERHSDLQMGQFHGIVTLD